MIRMTEGLPYVSVTLSHAGRQRTFDRVLVDTGSAGTVFATDAIAQLGLHLMPEDPIYRIHGIGGSEFIFTKRVEVLTVGTLVVPDFEIEVGGLAYELELDGILGMDFLLQIGAVLDFIHFTLTSGHVRP